MLVILDGGYRLAGGALTVQIIEEIWASSEAGVLVEDLGVWA